MGHELNEQDDLKIKRYDSSGLENPEGEFVLYTDHEATICNIYESLNVFFNKLNEAIFK